MYKSICSRGILQCDDSFKNSIWCICWENLIVGIKISLAGSLFQFFVVDTFWYKLQIEVKDFSKIKAPCYIWLEEKRTQWESSSGSMPKNKYISEINYWTINKLCLYIPGVGSPGFLRTILKEPKGARKIEPRQICRIVTSYAPGPGVSVRGSFANLYI